MMRIVVQCDLYGRKLREYPSAYDAARHVNGVPSSIQKCACGKSPTAYGFKWCYKDLDDISDLEYSMILERAYGEMTNVLHEYKARFAAAKKAALENGEKEPYHCRLVLDALDIVARDFRKRSDEAFAKHKATAEIDNTGAENLANGILARWAMDYETALSTDDEQALQELDFFAKKKAKLYTSLDGEDLIERIVSGHRRFKAKAHREIDDIIKVTDTFRRKRNAFSEKNNPHRCPLCGGGMYVKTKYKNNSYLVCCSGCDLSEVVTKRT
jgi:hypothetical protein